MRTYVAATVFAVFFGFAGLAQAAQLLSPGLSTHVRATNVTTYGACRIRNTGTSPVSVSVSLFSNNANIVDIDVCNGQPLAGGDTCLVTAFLPDDSFVACRVTAPTVIKLRGTLELSESTHPFNVFTAVDLD